MAHVALDLETLGTVPGSIIISIGAVRFNDNGLLTPTSNDTMDDVSRHLAQTEFYREITVASAGAIGLTFSHKTMAWWMKQSAQARQTLINAFEGDGAHDIRQVLGDFQAWLTTGMGYDEIWAWGQMDLPMLRSTFDRLGVPDPWNYKCERDGRTLCVELGLPRLEVAGTAHNALDDAKWLAQYVTQAKQYLAQARDGARMIQHMQIQQQMANALGDLPKRDAYGHLITETQDAQVEVVHNEGAAEPVVTQDRTEGDE